MISDVTVVSIWTYNLRAVTSIYALPFRVQVDTSLSSSGADGDGSTLLITSSLRGKRNDE
jgi:hypothetical protein